MNQQYIGKFRYAGIVAIGVALASGCASNGYKGPKPGETRYVSTEKVELKAAPDGFSDQVMELSYKDEVLVKEVEKVAPPFSGDKGMFPEFIIPCWLKVSASGTEGYVPMDVLVSDWLIANQDPTERISSEGMTVAKRGFSSDEDMDLASMRGAAGSGSFLKDADYGAVEKMYLDQRAHMVSADELKCFMKEGAFEGHPVLAEVVQVEEKGTLSKFADKSRQTVASKMNESAEKTENSDDPNAKFSGALTKFGAGLVYSESGPIQEFQIGESVAAKVLPAYKVVPMDDSRSVYLRKLAHALACASNSPMPYRGLMVVLVDSTEVNAFAVPGGFLIVTTGMLEFLRDEDELAAIIGHEIGHLELKHGMRAVGTEKVLNLFTLLKEAGLAAENKDDPATKKLREQMDELFGKMFDTVRNGYGIETESQADWRSLQLCNRLGYDTKALYDVLERFKTEKGTYGGASYPAERGADILKYRSQLGYGDTPAAGRDVRAARYRAALGK